MSEFARQEVKIGSWDGHGKFLGRVLRFSGREAGHYTSYEASRSRDDRGTSYTLYEVASGKYRMHCHDWSRWQGEGGSASLSEPLTLEEMRNLPDGDWTGPLAALGFPEEVDIE